MIHRMFTLIGGILLLIIGAALLHYYAEPIARIAGLVLVILGLLLIVLWVVDAAAVHDGSNGFVFGGPTWLLSRLIQRRRRPHKRDPFADAPGCFIRSPRP